MFASLMPDEEYRIQDDTIDLMAAAAGEGITTTFWVNASTTTTTASPITRIIIIIIMSTPYDEVIATDDNGPFQEYSVIYTDRALNLMSPPFCKVMTGLSSCLKSTYNGETVAIIPGSGTFAMEAVARQFATNKPVLVVRNGWFSFRWTEIFQYGDIPSTETVLKAQPVNVDASPQYAPMPIDTVVSQIAETQTGMCLYAPCRNVHRHDCIGRVHFQSGRRHSRRWWIARIGLYCFGNRVVGHEEIGH